MPITLCRLFRALAVLALLWPLAGGAAQGSVSITAGPFEVFYGVMPSAVLLGHPADHTERSMHGGVPTSPNSYHLVVSVFDAKSKTRITNADIRAQVTELGGAPQFKALQPMRMAEAITYGNYFTMSGPGPFRIVLDIAAPAGTPPQRVNFEHKHR